MTRESVASAVRRASASGGLSLERTTATPQGVPGKLPTRCSSRMSARERGRSGVDASVTFRTMAVPICVCMPCRWLCGCVDPEHRHIHVAELDRERECLTVRLDTEPLTDPPACLLHAGLT